MGRLTLTRQRNAFLFHADAAFDDRKTYALAIEKELVPLISYNPRKGKVKEFFQLPKRNWRRRALGEEGFRLWRTHKTQRVSAERYQSTFKYLLGGRVIPVRGMIKVTCYVLGMAILSQLSGLALIARRDRATSICRPTLLDFLSTATSNGMNCIALEI